ncbi:MAG: DGQHR domain-containing protein [Chloroflexi bacterium]|nr:DGQHR domain-containing protein [Chloroflexota bacterium]
MANEYIPIKCLEVAQPIGGFYVGVMNAHDLVHISFADIRALADRELDEYLGIQRQLSPKRVDELQRYVKAVDATFPTSIILAISSDDAEFNSDSGILLIRNDENVAKIIDGQHRIAGLRGYQGEAFQLNVTIFVDMDIEDQAMVFATINLAQTKVSKSLVYDLYEYTKFRSPQKTSHNIARLLNVKEGSPFHKRIKVLGTAAPGQSRTQTITQATFVEAMIRMISGGSKRALEDRDLLKRDERPARANTSETKDLVFRNMFLDKQDAEIASVIWNYFGAVSDKWSSAWNGLNITGNILPRTNGFKALMRVFPRIYLQIGKPGEVPPQSIFYQFMKKIPMESGQFTTEIYKPGAEGENKLYKDLLSGIESS